MNFNQLATRRAVRWMLLILILWLAAFLRFYALGRQSLWDGEIFTLLFAQYDWSKLVPSVGMFSAHPPLWFVLSKIATAFDWNETVLRAPAAFAGILAVPALYVLGKRLLGAPVGMIGAALLAFSPISVLFSQNARNYALFVLLVILLVYAAYRATLTRAANPPPSTPIWSGARSTVWWLLFVAAAIAGLYTHYLFVLPLAGTVLAIALKLMNDAAQIHGGWRNVREWWGVALVSARPFLIALIAITALYLPWTPTVGSAFLGRQLTREAGQSGDEDAAITVQDLPRLFKDFSGAATWGLVLLSVLAIIGIVWVWWAQRRRADGRAGASRAALFWFGISLVLPLAVMILLAPRRLPAKYLIYVLPAYLLFVANGIVGVAEFLGERVFKSERIAYAPAVGLVIVLAIATLPNMPYWDGTKTIFTGKGWQVVDEWQQWREVAASVASRVAPGDSVLFPEEARALTARSVVPYFDDAFYEKLYSAPPQGKVWWVSQTADVPASNASRVNMEEQFGGVVMQELAYSPQFRALALPNPSFDQGFTGWDKPEKMAQWTRDEKQHVDGTAAARVTLNGSSFGALRSAAFEVTPGKLYRVTAYVKNPTVGFYTTSPQLGVNFYAGTDKPQRRTRLVTLLPSDKPGWSLMAIDGIVPADTSTARVEFIFRDYAYELGRTSWIDGVKVWLEE